MAMDTAKIRINDPITWGENKKSAIFLITSQ